MKSNNNIICINCSNRGHTFKDCGYPITSYGIIGYKKIKNHIKYVLVQRKDTMGYIDFVRGRFNCNLKKEDVYKVLIQEMTLEEKQRLLKMNFDEIWDRMWMNKKSRIYKNEYENAKKKFNSIDVKNMIKDSINETKWTSTEFSIPKGRRNNSENYIDCALREFSEETGIKKNQVKKIINKRVPLEEVFYGSNGIAYSHVYYIAEINTEYIPEIDYTNILQAGEIKNINWFSYKQAMNIFRNYESSKRAIIHKVHKIIEKQINETS